MFSFYSSNLFFSNFTDNDGASFGAFPLERFPRGFGEDKRGGGEYSLDRLIANTGKATASGYFLAGSKKHSNLAPQNDDADIVSDDFM